MFTSMFVTFGVHTGMLNAYHYACVSLKRNMALISSKNNQINQNIMDISN